MALSKEVKQQIKDELEYVNSVVCLLCDGYLVRADHQGCFLTGKDSISIYVDGRCDGAWCNFDNQDEEANRFYPTHKEKLYSSAEIKKYKLKVKAKDNVYYYRKSYFSTANVFCNHISKHNKSIQVISYEEYKSRLAEKEKANED